MKSWTGNEKRRKLDLIEEITATVHGIVNFTVLGSKCPISIEYITLFPT